LKPRTKPGVAGQAPSVAAPHIWLYLPHAEEPGNQERKAAAGPAEACCLRGEQGAASAHGTPQGNCSIGG